jgi:hypothetical protein
MVKRTIRIMTGVMICLAPLCRTAGAQNETVVSLDIKVEAEDVIPLPDQSTIELNASESDCARTIHQAKPLHDGKATFKDVPVCKVMLTIFVTGFRVQKVPLDLAGLREFAILVQIRNSGPAQISAVE